MSVLLILGLIMGIRHTLKPDHVAAVLALSAQSRSLSATAKQGAIWGVGHTIMLFIFSIMLLDLHTKIDRSLFILFGIAVGLIIIIIGIDILNKTSKLYSERKIEKSKIAITESRNNNSLLFKALGIGSLHGAAGSGIIIALVTTTLESTYLKFTYIALFSLGLVASMSLLSLLMSVPLHHGNKYFLARYLKVASEALAILVGMKIIYGFGTQVNNLVT